MARFLADPTAPGWRAYFSHLLALFSGPLLLACNFDSRYLPVRFPAFYKRVLVDFFSLPRGSVPIVTAEQIAAVLIWHNRNLLIGGKPFFFPE